MEDLDIHKLKSIFKSVPAVKSAYIFGSRATGKAVKNSDYDFAVLFDGSLSKENRFDLKLELMAKLSRALRTDAVDVVVLNDVSSLFFKYIILKEGKSIYQKSDLETAEFESRALGLYFDFRPFMEEYSRNYLMRN